MAWEAAFCITCLSNWDSNIDWTTPYSLVYGMEAVLPIEVEIPSLRVLREVELEEAEWVQARYEQLNLIEEKRIKAIYHGQLYQRRMMRAHDKKIWPRQFQEGELVLKRIPQNWQAWKMVTQLGRALCCEKGILRRSIDTHRDGWERVLGSHQCRHSKRSIMLEMTREAMCQSWKLDRAAPVGKSGKRNRKEKGKGLRWKPERIV